MDLLWTESKLLQLPKDTRRWLKFYAPLLTDLYFWGVDPVAYARAGTTSADYRGGAKTIAANVPPFEYDGELPLGLYLASPAALSFSGQNGLSDGSTVIWFEDGVPKSTPSNANPFDSNGVWVGNLSKHIKHIVKASVVLSTAMIAQIQILLEDVAQAFPELPGAPSTPIGAFVTETPTHSSGAIYTLSADPDLESLLVSAHGGLWLRRVASGPNNLQFTAGGAGNRTLTLGLAPSPVGDIEANYVTA